MVGGAPWDRVSRLPQAHSGPVLCPRFVSPGSQGMAALCQHKLLGALEQTSWTLACLHHSTTQPEGWMEAAMAADVHLHVKTSCSGLPMAACPPPLLTPSYPQPSRCIPDLPMRPYLPCHSAVGFHGTAPLSPVR